MRFYDHINTMIKCKSKFCLRPGTSMGFDVVALRFTNPSLRDILLAPLSPKFNRHSIFS